MSVHYVGQMHVRKRGDDTEYFGPLALPWLVIRGAVGLLWAALRLHGDIYHIGKPHPQNGLAGLVAARLLRRRLLLDYDDLEAESNRVGSKLQRWVLAWLEDHLPGWVDGVTTHASFLAERLCTLGVPNERILRLPNAIGDEWFNSNDPPANQNAPLILFVGTLSLANHPVDLLLRAFAELSARRRGDAPPARLKLVGGGPDIQLLKQLASELGVDRHCEFTGRVARDDVRGHFAQASLSVDPVLVDNTARARWPLKIVESLASGVPVVTGDIGDRRAILGLVDGDCPAGVVVPPGDASALARAIEHLLTDSERLTRLRTNCKSQASRYAASAMVSHLVRFYAAQLDRR